MDTDRHQKVPQITPKFTPNLKIYKVYLESDSMILTLAEVIELTDANPRQVRTTFLSKACSINGFEIINLGGQ
jgi:hypothetical protein